MATPQTGAGDPVRSSELLWRAFEPQHTRPGPKPRLTVEQIVTAAIALADRDGLGALNMRNVAAELDVGTMSLYRYVPGKGELLDLMVDAVNAPDGDEPDTAGMDWREVLEYLASSTLTFYAAHPWILEVNQKRPVLGPQSLRGLDFALAAFDDHDLSDREAILIITAVFGTVTGIALSYLIQDVPADQGGPVSTEEEWWEVQLPYLQRAMESGRFPRMSRLDQEDAWNVTPETAVRHTLDAYLAGIAPRMEATYRPGARSPGRDAT
ncbi:TetR/AcrR family transcriptional regulator [Glycomyces paridis]|uniref:TetR/AcrR family transcriptional regulator n=1 Tax=Glycomyces paridis TaxID=2126555 RepID=A0A4S8PF93_9ACTN|nr:TetR/AcrR family transcriptional regulator [Glycomyces paridis]THV26999.1 TetR/AcrR family transcriptional regulator [Glycomyces paridis]